MPSSNSPNFTENYIVQLATISGMQQQLLSSSESIILGDFQCCPSVVGSTRNTTTNTLSPHLNNFNEENNMIPIDMTNGTGPLYTYHHISLPNKCYIDHILVSQDIQSFTSNTRVLDHHYSNRGDQLPVTTTITTKNVKQNNNNNND